MTYLIRRIEDEKYARWVKAGDVDWTHAKLPSWAVEDFIPSVRDKGGLSVFEVDDRSAPQIIAASFAFCLEDKLETQISFACVEKEKLSHLGLNIKTTPGKLRNKFSNQQHRELEAEEIDTSISLAREFLMGEIFVFNKKEVLDAVKLEASANRIDFEKIDAAGFDRNKPGRNLMRLIGLQVVSIQGVGQQP